MMSMTVTIEIAEDHEPSWQKVYEVFLPTKDCREAMEKTENNPVARGLQRCFPDEDRWRVWLSKRKARKCQGLNTLYPGGKGPNEY